MTNRTSTTCTVKQSASQKVVAVLKHRLAEGRYEGGMLPSYRQIVRELGVTMASVERAMAELESEGLVHREGRRGVIPRASRPVVSPGKPFPLQSITFVTPSLKFAPPFVEYDYLAGYTEALDHLPVRMRFAVDDDLKADCDQLFLPSIPLEKQGIVLINSCRAEVLNCLRERNVPFVVQHHRRYPTAELPAHFSVYVNKYAGAFSATRHLLNLGHRRVGYFGPINGDPQNTAFDGYRAALNYAGLDCTEDAIAHCSLDARDKQAILALANDFLSNHRPSAVFAVSDDYALMLIETAQALNLRVPEDLSIVGMDDQPWAEKCSPPLTTISIPRRELAKSAVQLLIKAAGEPGAQPHMRILETHLILRATTAPFEETS